MSKRSYTRLTESQWDEAAERNARGETYEQIAERFGTSVRAVATNLPPAQERRRLALAASATGSAATSPMPAIAIASVPDVTDREGATRHWRQTAWADAQAIQARLRQEMASPAPDARNIRALSAGAAALKDLIRIGGDVLEVDKHAADEIIPELVIRELTDIEVMTIRTKQRQEQGDDLDEDERQALAAFANAEQLVEAETEDESLVIEG
ncbi:hypothetical protein [Kozakia baliensis]|uniref:hypothetical protein n=1 Tax=Kozakia baliensis TaxID=153496 RepID=UPI00087BD520|nr:hypothetical protein [Kozakia baliensis]AOX20716.1 hypothetical protein A0U90_10975 [Kozakia baliensis]